MAKYSKPSVVEIICLFRFSSGENWTSKKPGELLEAFKDSYPNFEPTQDMEVGIHIKDGGITPELLTPKQKYVYSDEQDKSSITVASDFFAFVYKNHQNDYKTWQESFEPSLKAAWEKVRGSLSITAIQSIGLRYINHIKLSDDFAAKDVLNPTSKYLPAAISESQSFFNRGELVLDEKNNLVITTGVAHHENDRIVILDMDRIVTDTITVAANTLPAALTGIQLEIEKVFESAISDKLRTRMK